MQAAIAEPSDALLRFNDEVLEQAFHLVAAHAMPEGPRLAGPVGAHLRHIIEHHQALLTPAQAGVVDYDSRARDRLVETHPAVATQRLLALREALAQWHPDTLSQPVLVRGLVGTTGSDCFEVPSTRGRELAFVASHAVHHFALLKARGLNSGIALPAHFGVAPATVAHESRQIHEEPTCPPSLQAA